MITAHLRPAGIRTGKPAMQQAQESQQKVDELSTRIGSLEHNIGRIDGFARDAEIELSTQELAFQKASSGASIGFKTVLAGAGLAVAGALVSQLVPGMYGLAATAVGALLMVGGGVVLTNSDVQRTEAAIRRGGLSDRVKIFDEARLSTSATIDKTRHALGTAERDRDAAMQRVQDETAPVAASIDVSHDRVNIGGLSIPRRA